MYTKGDFHSHSTCSDGTLSPEELVSLAKEQGLDIMALTDHDSTDGVDRAIDAGKKLGIKVIPAFELSTIHNDETVHVLAYFNDSSYKNSELQDFLKKLVDYRKERAKKIVANLEKYFNISISYDDVYEKSKGSVARPHIARTIIDSGYNYSYDYIFDNFLCKKSPAFVPNLKISTEEGIKKIHEFNGIAVLAHPILIKKNPVEELFNLDFDGIECRYILNTDEDTKRFLNLAKRFGKFTTAGSDFHTKDSSDTKHGIIGTKFLEGEELSTFLEKLNIYK